MYAVIRTGGKQYKVEAGEQLEVERLGLDDGSEVELAPILVVDGETNADRIESAGLDDVGRGPVDDTTEAEKIDADEL